MKAASAGEKAQSVTRTLTVKDLSHHQPTTVAYSGCSALQHPCVVHCCRLQKASPAGGWAAVGEGRDSAALNGVLCFLASIQAHEHQYKFDFIDF